MIVVFVLKDQLEKLDLTLQRVEPIRALARAAPFLPSLLGVDGSKTYLLLGMDNSF